MWPVIQLSSWHDAPQNSRIVNARFSGLVSVPVWSAPDIQHTPRRARAARLRHPAQQYCASDLRHAGRSSRHHRQHHVCAFSRRAMDCALLARLPAWPVQKYR